GEIVLRLLVRALRVQKLDRRPARIVGLLLRERALEGGLRALDVALGGGDVLGLWIDEIGELGLGAGEVRLRSLHRALRLGKLRGVAGGEVIELRAGARSVGLGAIE